jgi:hypothetical protein
MMAVAERVDTQETEGVAVADGQVVLAVEVPAVEVAEVAGVKFFKTVERVVVVVSVCLVRGAMVQVVSVVVAASQGVEVGVLVAATEAQAVPGLLGSEVPLVAVEHAQPLDR